jgi:hypothetical protein
VGGWPTTKVAYYVAALITKVAYSEAVIVPFDPRSLKIYELVLCVLRFVPSRFWGNPSSVWCDVLAVNIKLIHWALTFKNLRL